MATTTGTVNEHLLPIVPVDVRNGVGQWQRFNVLLDTGFNGDLMLEADILASYGLSGAVTHIPLNYEESWDTSQNGEGTPPIRAELLWAGAQYLVKVESLHSHPFKGMLGTNLLKYKRVAIDVIGGGEVTVDTDMVLPRGFLSKWRSSKRESYRPHFDDPGDYLKWAESSLPWAHIQVEDSRGQWHNLEVNVDTGSSGELSLPTKLVDKLGLRLPNPCQIQAHNGIIDTECGAVEVKWRGRQRRIVCAHRTDDSPPLIGMQLLEGNRVTIEFDLPWPTVEIGKIPASPKLIDKLVSPFRCRI